MADLLDVNVLVALSLAGHASNARAQRYWRQEAARSIILCRTSILGLLRVTSQLQAFAGDPDAIATAWRAYEKLVADPSVSVLPEPSGLDGFIGRWVQAGALSLSAWTDAYFAAFAISGNYRLVTLDRDFKRFPGLNALILDP